jgi:hypothetical protein
MASPRSSSLSSSGQPKSPSCYFFSIGRTRLSRPLIVSSQWGATHLVRCAPFLQSIWKIFEAADLPTGQCSSHFEISHPATGPHLFRRCEDRVSRFLSIGEHGDRAIGHAAPTAAKADG